MQDQARQMYQEQILEHYHNPLNCGVIKNPSHQYHNHNPLCGDELTVYLKVDKGVIKKVRYQAQGCALSVSAMSLLSGKVEGKSVESILEMTKDDILEIIGIQVGPVRLKCVLLGLQTLQQALRSS